MGIPKIIQMVYQHVLSLEMRGSSKAVQLLDSNFDVAFPSFLAGKEAAFSKAQPQRWTTGRLRIWKLQPKFGPMMAWHWLLGVHDWAQLETKDPSRPWLLSPEHVGLSAQKNITELCTDLECQDLKRSEDLPNVVLCVLA